MDRDRFADFDGLAPLYRWLEYLTLGPMLARARNHHIGQLGDRRQALILGDGDGRFTAKLLALYPELRVEVVDLSTTMLRLLQRRASKVSASSSLRLSVHRGDARSFDPQGHPDLVVTHFFLDCLTQEQVSTLVERLAHTLAPGALWLVSEFRIPAGMMHWPARMYVRLLYFAFRILTGLRVRRLPDFAQPLRRAGFAPLGVHRSLFGMLTTEIWMRS